MKKKTYLASVILISLGIVLFLVAMCFPDTDLSYKARIILAACIICLGQALFIFTKKYYENKK